MKYKYKVGDVVKYRSDDYFMIYKVISFVKGDYEVIHLINKWVPSMQGSTRLCDKYTLESAYELIPNPEMYIILYG